MIENPFARRPPRAEDVAVVVAATLALVEAPAESPGPTTPSWRFSGRWFHAHPYSEMRRPSR